VIDPEIGSRKSEVRGQKSEVRKTAETRKTAKALNPRMKLNVQHRTFNIE